MRVLTLVLGIGIMLTAACGGGSSSPGGTGGTGGGGSGGSSIPLTGACASLTCLNPMMNLLMGCQSGGTCTTASAMTGTSVLATSCYSNGVKEQTSMDMSSATAPMVMTVKNGSSLCYSMDVSGVSLSGTSGPMTIAIKNGSGALVGTISIDSTAGTESVTCPGGAATTIDDTCGTGATGAQPSVPTTSGCTQGACTF